MEFMKNIVLIGMPGTGKSTVGNALAEQLNYTFVDLDDNIKEAAGKSLPDILRQDGLEAFFKIEEEVGTSVELENSIIATGGSMVLYPAAMEHLKENGVIVWLETSLSEISRRMPADLTDRGIAAPPGVPLRKIYEQRQPLYSRYADIIVVSREGAGDTAREVLQLMRTVGIEL